MKKRIGKQVLCLLLTLSLVMGFMPVTSFAGWEDGEECEFCGRYRFDDWLCDCGPHCSESSATDDCFLENHCAECLEAVANSDRCDTCYICPDCMSDGVVLHCALCGACDEGGYDICDDCDLCMNCQIEAGTHCFDCGDCLESGSQCPDHPFEMYQENHCESCALKCSGCEDKCFLGETFIDIYCEEHELCVVCATDEGLHCKECYGCYEDELCSECQKCDECGLESGEHCPECDAHGEDWCETGGEGTHCVECASEYLCEQCDVCTSCSGTEFCDECGLCIECCRENAESENCSCGEYCIESANWEEHFCADCGTCFDENEQCETCEYCIECCASQSECGEGMCVEDTDYDEHFCEECQSCFHEVEACESCQDAGVSLCTECCASLTEDYGCSHEYCTSSWQWDEHYCDICGKCYGDVDCTHDATAHIHTYDVNGNCTVCGYNKDGKPVITKQPKSVTANPKDTAAVYTVEAMGENLTYQWYYINLSTGKPVAMTDGTAYEGTKTKSLTVTVADGMCSLGKPVQIFCVVKNLNGNVTTSTVNFLVAHQYDKYTTDKTYHWYSCENCDKIKDKTEHRFNAWTILKQASQTENGLKRRVCYDCNYADTVIIPKLPADHVHDYSAAFVKTDTFHWTKCACGNENKGAMEEHNFGNGWITTIQPTLTSVGEETRTCGVCGYVETREIEKQGHTHEFYNEEYLENHKDNGNSGYLLNNGYIVNLYSEPYGKKTNTYHYAYCVVDGCDAYERYTHKWYTEWYDVPTDAIDGSYEKKCSDCFYTTGLKSLPAGKYRVITKNCTTNIQAAAPGSTVKISLYKDYPAGYYVNFNESDPNACIDVNYTWGNGATGTWAIIEEEYHAPDEKNPKGYWTFTMPDLPTDKNTDWLKFYVEVEVELLDCTEDNHGDGRGLEWRNQREATCGKTGYTGDYMCKWCNYIEERGHDTPATGEHGELIAEPDYVGDCDHAGYTGAKRCSVCDEIIVPREYHGKTHKVTKVEGTYIAATCTSKGQSSQYVCGRCGIVLTKSKSTAKLPHDWQFVEEVPATCTTKGMKAHYQCTVCNRYSEDKNNEFVSNRSLIIPSLGGHKWADATCAAPKTCTVCEATQGEKLDTHKTNIVKYGKDNHWTECACGETSTSYEKHQLSSWTVDKKASTNAVGSRHKSCDCGYVLTEAIPQITNIKLSDTSYLYSGEAIKPGVDIRDMNNGVLKEGTDYSLKYENNINAGTGKVTITFKGNYEGTVTKTFTINKRDITKWMSSLSYTTTTYNGSAKKPTVTLKNSSNVVLDDEHYTVTYTNNVNAGKATVTIKGKDNYTGTITKTFTITTASISGKSASLSYTSTTYDGTAKKPTVKISGLTKDKDYTVAYKNNTSAGTATVTITGKGNYRDTITKTFTINKASMTGIKVSGKEVTYNANSHTITVSGVPDGAKVYYKTSSSGSYSTTKPSRTSAGTTTVYYKVTKTNYKDVTGSVKITINKKKISEASLSKTTYVYNGEVKKPTVTVKAGTLTPASKISKSNSNVTIKYADGRKNVGKYKVTITGKGNYTGTITKTFMINPKATKITSLTKGDNAFTVKWEKRTTQTTGYQIYYTTYSTRKKGKTVTISSNKTTSKKISKLKNKKKYYVWVRTYKTVNGTKYYSTWSDRKSVTTK